MHNAMQPVIRFEMLWHLKRLGIAMVGSMFFWVKALPRNRRWMPGLVCGCTWGRKAHARCLAVWLLLFAGGSLAAAADGEFPCDDEILGPKSPAHKPLAIRAPVEAQSGAMVPVMLRLAEPLGDGDRIRILVDGRDEALRAEVSGDPQVTMFSTRVRTTNGRLNAVVERADGEIQSAETGVKVVKPATIPDRGRATGVRLKYRLKKDKMVVLVGLQMSKQQYLRKMKFKMRCGSIVVIPTLRLSKYPLFGLQSRRSFDGTLIEYRDNHGGTAVRKVTAKWKPKLRTVVDEEDDWDEDEEDQEPEPKKHPSSERFTGASVVLYQQARQALKSKQKGSVQRAEALLIASASTGFPLAELDLARLNLGAHGHDVDHAQARRWARRAMEHGLESAGVVFYLAVMEDQTFRYKKNGTIDHKKYAKLAAMSLAERKLYIEAVDRLYRAAKVDAGYSRLFMAYWLMDNVGPGSLGLAHKYLERLKGLPEDKKKRIASLKKAIASLDELGDTLVTPKLYRDVLPMAISAAYVKYKQRGGTMSKCENIRLKSAERKGRIKSPLYLPLAAKELAKAYLVKGVWREKWRFDVCGRKESVLIRFRADGFGGAYYDMTIKKGTGAPEVSTGNVVVAGQALSSASP